MTLSLSFGGVSWILTMESSLYCWHLSWRLHPERQWRIHCRTWSSSAVLPSCRQPAQIPPTRTGHNAIANSNMNSHFLRAQILVALGKEHHTVAPNQLVQAAKSHNRLPFKGDGRLNWAPWCLCPARDASSTVMQMTTEATTRPPRPWGWSGENTAAAAAEGACSWRNMCLACDMPPELNMLLVTLVI